MSDWSDEKAKTLCPIQAYKWHKQTEASCGYCDGIAAALREAREQGAREERAACWDIASTCSEDACDCARRIDARGPMSEPKEEAKHGE